MRTVKYGWIAILGITVLLFTVAVSSAANRNFNQAKTIRIGVLGPVQMVPGIGIFDSAKMAAEEINAAGGIDGKKIVIYQGDTEGKPEKAISALQKLVLQNKVDALIGTYSSGVALALQPYLRLYKIVFISTGTASTALTNNVAKHYQKYKYFFRDMVNAMRQEEWAAKFLTEFVHGKLGYTRFAILSESAKWTEKYAPKLKSDLEKAGLHVVYFERFDPALEDFSPIFADIKAKKAQWIAEIVSHANSVALVKAWQDSHAAPMGLIDVSSADSKFWGMTGGKCLYQITYNFIARGPLTDRTIPYWDKYTKTFGSTPVYTSGYTYDSMYMLSKVIEEKKSLKTEDIINGLENISYKGVLSSNTHFNKKTHDLAKGAYVLPMVQWQAGAKQVVVWPSEFKSGPYVSPAWWGK